MAWLLILSASLHPVGGASGGYTPKTPRTARPSGVAAAGRNPLTGELLPTNPPPPTHTPTKSLQSAGEQDDDHRETVTETRISARAPYEGMLLTFGGHDGEGFLSSAESYIPGYRAWKSECVSLYIVFERD